MDKHKKPQPQKPVEIMENKKSIDNMRFTVRNDYAFKKLFGRQERMI